MTKVFIDGSAGTTGLRIRQRLAQRTDLELIVLDEALRKDPAARREALYQSDVTFLCLPDAAAIEAAGFTPGPHTVPIRTGSTAFRSWAMPKRSPKPAGSPTPVATPAAFWP